MPGKQEEEKNNWSIFDPEWQDIYSNLRLFEKYNKKLKEFLVVEIQAIRSEYKELHKRPLQERQKEFVGPFKLTPSEIQLKLELRILEEDFLPRIRKSLFVSLYNFFLASIIKLGKIYAENRENEIDSWQGLERIKRNLQALDFGLDIGSHHHWATIKYYNKIRNSIVHDNGYITKKETDLSRYLHKNKCITKNQEIIISNSFYNGAVNVLEDFLWDIIRELRKTVTTTMFLDVVDMARFNNFFIEE